MKPTLKLVMIATVCISGLILSPFFLLLSSLNVAYGQTPDQALSSPSPSEQPFSPAPSTTSPSSQTPEQALSSPSPSSNQTTAQQEEQPPSSGILGLLFPHEQPPSQSTPIQPPIAAPTTELTANGTINSLIFTPGTTWIAAGNWSMVLRNGNVNSFDTNMIWYNNNGTRTHTHELLNFKPSVGIAGGAGGEIITVKPGDNVLMKGLMDVGTNHRITWKNVHSTIDIKGGKTISISLDDGETNKHFAGQTIYGIVKSFSRCSDQPGPNMEVLAPCSSSSSFSPS